jgi:hypothetical protein
MKISIMGLNILMFLPVWWKNGAAQSSIILNDAIAVVLDSGITLL